MNIDDVVSAIASNSGPIVVNGYILRRRESKLLHRGFYAVTKDHELLGTYGIHKTNEERAKLATSFLELVQG